MMNRTFMMVSILVSMLTIQSASALELQKAPIAATPLGELLKSCVNQEDFLYELTALLYRKKLDEKGLRDFLGCLNKEKICELFGIQLQEIERFFDTDELIKFFSLFFQEKSVSKAACSKKAHALKNSFNRAPWKELIGDTFEDILSAITELCFFTGTKEEKKEIGKRLMIALETINPPLPEDDNHPLFMFLNKEPLYKLVHDLASDKDSSPEQLFELFNTKKVQDKLSKSSLPIDTYFKFSNLLRFIARLSQVHMKADLPLLKELLESMRWDSLFIMLLEQLNIQGNYIDLQALKKVIADFQEEKELTADELKGVINKQLLGDLGATIEQFIDFELLAQGLNKARQGVLSEELKKAIKLKRMSELVGFDVSSLFNTNLPEPVQMSRWERFINHVRNTEPFAACYQGLPLLGTYIILCNIGKIICAPCMEALDPQSWYSIGTVLVTTSYLTYTSTQYLRRFSAIKQIALALAATKATRALAHHLTKASLKKSDLLNDAATHPMREAIAQFLELLTDEHLNVLPDTVELIQLFENPLTFIATHELFIKGLCTIDRERSLERIQFIKELLDHKVKVEELPHGQSMLTFFSHVPDDLALLLPHTGLLLLALHCPEILSKQHTFLRKASLLTYNAGGRALPVISHFHQALEEAELYIQQQ